MISHETTGTDRSCQIELPHFDICQRRSMVALTGQMTS